jgi:hypothetical protein
VSDNFFLRKVGENTISLLGYQPSSARPSLVNIMEMAFE